MRIIAAYFAQFTWIAVLLAVFIVSPAGLPDNAVTYSRQNPEPSSGSNTHIGGYDTKKAALEEYIATIDVGIPYRSVSDAAEQPAENPPEPVVPGNTESNPGSRGDKKQEAPASEYSGKGTSNKSPSGRQEASENTGSADNDSKEPPAVKQSFNQIVLDVIKTYNGRNYPYLLNEDYANYNGVTENIYYDGQLFLKAHPSGNRASHCSGITFEVFFKAMQEWNKQRSINTGRIGNLSYMQLMDFMLLWYVAGGDKEQGNLTTALTRYGLGKRITDMSAAQPGDFIDISRENNTGHTAVFLGWIWEDGQIVGLKYWSSQGSTGGISVNREYFNVLRRDGTKYGKVMIDKVYIGRVTP